MVLFWYQNKFNNMSDFMKDISKKYPIAFYLMLQYLRKKSIDEENFNELNDILNQENLITEQVCTTIAVALKQEVLCCQFSCNFYKFLLEARSKNANA